MNPAEIVDFWVDEVGPKGWYMGGEELDQTIRDRYMDLWEEASKGGLHDWLTQAPTSLAYIILTDQFPRNMFRDDGRAFATDKAARCAAKKAIDHEFDLKIDGAARQFFYMPLMHAECLMDQDRCVRLMVTRLDYDGMESNILHAKAHREVIRQFGRFPTRNAALDRTNSPSEQAYLDDGGYGTIVENLKAMA